MNQCDPPFEKSFQCDPPLKNPGYAHGCVTVFYQQIENSNIANQIHGFTRYYGKFILIFARNIKNLDVFKI